MELLLTTHPGLEDVAYEELAERLGEGALERRPHRLRGRVEVTVDLPPEAVRGEILKLRTVHHVLEPVLRVELDDPPTLDAIRAAVAGAEVPELEHASSFRVSTKRIGRHGFTSVDIERAAGAALVGRYGTAVKLDAPAVVVRVDLVDRGLAVARPLTAVALSERPGRPFHQRVGLKANVAAAAVRLARLEAPRRVLDPFCGSGSLLSEVGHAFGEAELWANDWIEKAAQGTLRNLEHDGFGDRAHALCHDARALGERFPAGYFDAIVTNPPFGVRLGRKIDFYAFYGQMLRALRPLLAPRGHLTVLTDRKSTFDSALKSTGGFERLGEVHVQLGDVAPWIVSLRRADALDPP